MEKTGGARSPKPSVQAENCATAVTSLLGELGEPDF